MRKDTCPALQRPLCPRRHRWCRLPGGWARTPLDCTSNWVRQSNCINPTATKFPHLIWSLVPDTAFKNQMVSFSKPGPVCSRLHVPMCDVKRERPAWPEPPRGHSHVGSANAGREGAEPRCASGQLLPPPSQQKCAPRRCNQRVTCTSVQFTFWKFEES